MLGKQGFLSMSREKLLPAAMGCNCVWVVELCWWPLSGALRAKETKWPFQALQEAGARKEIAAQSLVLLLSVLSTEPSPL